jgi:Terminase large subunit, T4likevirus-type, N-terminal
MTGMAQDLLLALDCDRFARAAGLEGALDDWQRRVLEASESKVLMNCSRQSGKSTTAALLALRVALYQPDALVLLVSPSMRQSSELFRRTLGFYHALPEPKPAVAAESALRMELRGGSRIISLPGSERTTRGYSRAAAVILDEAARVPDELIASLRPMQATSAAGRKFVALSTPFGRRGWFFEQWQKAGADRTWLRVEIPAKRCPRISEEFLEEQLEELGPRAYSEEYECQFQDDGQALFTGAIIERAFTARVKPFEWGRMDADELAACA